MAPPSVPSPVTTPSLRNSSRDIYKTNSVLLADASGNDQQQQQEPTRIQPSNQASTPSTTPAVAATTLPSPLTDAALLSPPSSLYNGAGMYGGNFGMGMYGGGGMGSMYGGGGLYGGGGYGGYGTTMMGMGGMLGGPLNTLNQVLFSVQTLVFSLGQAVQIIGMNTQAIKQLFESLTGMLDHVVATIRELQVLEHQKQATMTDEQLKRKRRLQMVRWTLATAVSYVVYKVVRRVTKRRDPQQIQYGNYLPQPPPPNYGGYNSNGAGYGGSYGHGMNPYASSSYGSPYGPSSAAMSQPYQASYGGGGYHGSYGGGSFY